MRALFIVIALAGAGRHAAPPPKHIDIDTADVVEGATPSASGQEVFARKQARFGSLMKLRQDFRPELLKSGE